MKMKIFCTFFLLAFFLNAFGQTIEKTGKTDIEKKVETYIIAETNPLNFCSIEFGKKSI